MIGGVGKCSRCIVAPPIIKTSYRFHANRFRFARLCDGTGIRRVSTGTPNYAEDDGTSKLKRGGRRTSVKLKDLPQGLLNTKHATDIPQEEPAPVTVYPTVIQQARDNMTKFPNCVVLTRVGGFYELYFQQAEEWSSQLNLKLARKKTSAGAVPMAGFPAFQLERFLKALVQDHQMHVAIAEEIANDPSQRMKKGGLLFDRQIKRIVTPGTLIDEDFLTPNEHNYLLCISNVDDAEESDNTSLLSSSSSSGAVRQLSLAWIDVSSGDFRTQTAPVAALGSVVTRVAPREIVIDAPLRGSPLIDLSTLEEQADKITYYNTDNADAAIRDTILELDNEQNTAPVSADAQAIKMLVSYIEEHLPGTKVRLQQPKMYEAAQHVSIDKNTLKGLEIVRTLKHGSEKGALLQTVRRTSTRSGARLLSQRLVAPSTSLSEIDRRLDLVQDFMAHPALLEEITALLKRTTDSPRLIQAIAFGKGDAQDLLNLSRTIGLTKRVAEVLQQNTTLQSPLNHESNRFYWNGPAQLAERIQNAIDEEGLMTRYQTRQNDAADAAALAQEAIAAEGADDMAALHKRLGSIRSAKTAISDESDSEEDTSAAEVIWIMRKSASSILNNLHDHLSALRAEVQDLAAKLQSQLQAKSLSLKLTPGLGHIVHVKGRDTKSDFSTIIKEARTVSTSKSTRSFYLPAWTSLGRRIEDAKLRIRTEEQQIFRSLREGVCENIVALRRNANVLDELDVACSSATLAEECGLVRPVLDDTTSMHIVDGRHMTVEAGLKISGRSFTPNDTIIGTSYRGSTGSVDANSRSDQQSIHLITGPNMAGKSTYLRQTALMSILAQTGLYVPASFALLGLVDAVFSRIGSADNLYQDQSTFMVEMLETAEILKNASKKSLVVMDEVGRGTSPEDGIAVGYAALDTLRKRGVGRVLFATHFHQILDMCCNWPEVGCYCTRVVEDKAGDGAETTFRFDHKMRPGINRDSHALKVAKLAGMPDATVQTAKDVLEGMKRKQPQD